MDCNQNNSIRFLRKSQNENERRLIASWWEEATNIYGTYVDYFRHGYSLTGHDFLYGEEPTAEFSTSQGLVILADMSNDSLLLSKFGIQSLADFTAIIPIKAFKDAFGENAEPKADDLIRLTELGWDRPGTPNELQHADTSSLSGACDYTGGDSIPSTESAAYSGYATVGEWARGAPIFQITERRDDNIQMSINPLLGHYVWIVHGKRFDYSYEPGIDPPPGSDQITDDTFSGRLSGGQNDPSDDKLYDQDLEDESNTIFDYDEYPGSDPEVYGNY